MKDDLKELLDAVKEEGEAAPLTEPELFIQEMGLKHSDINTNHIPNCVIYWNYMMWKEARGESDLIARPLFFRGWTKKFKQRGHKKHFREYYLTASEKFKMPTKEELYHILADIRREREWYAKKRKAKLRRKSKKEALKSIQD